MSVKTGYEHIVLENGIPVIAGTTMKVVELVVEKNAYGWSPEELQFHHAYLSLGQIHSALAYYWDHMSELDDDIERRLRYVRQVEDSNRPSRLASRLKAKGTI